MNKLLALADRVEKLNGPDREVGLEIELALGLVPEPYERAVCHGVPQMYFWDREDTHAPYVQPERYTGSIDAAMTLVPEGCSTNIMMAKGRLCAAQVHHFLPGAIIPSHQICASAATPALALVAAALRARAHGGGED